jgi:hypothetical protein
MLSPRWSASSRVKLWTTMAHRLELSHCLRRVRILLQKLSGKKIQAPQSMLKRFLSIQSLRVPLFPRRRIFMIIWQKRHKEQSLAAGAERSSGLLWQSHLLPGIILPERIRKLSQTTLPTFSSKNKSIIKAKSASSQSTYAATTKTGSVPAGPRLP